MNTKTLADLIETKLNDTPTAARFGKTLTATTDPRTTPLKGTGGQPLSRDAWEEAPYSKADGDFRYIADPDDRATGVLQYWTGTEAAAKQAALNIKSGRPSLDGIDLTSDVFSHLIGDGYELSDLKADIDATARKLLDWEARETDLGTVYK